MSSHVHDAAQRGYTSEASTYERGRPEYPVALDAWLRDTLRLGPGRHVADVGAGTGKFCRRLLATGADVVAVEPVDAMREQASRIDGLRTLAATAQAIPLPEASLDAIACAQAFHWFASTQALDEFARVLRPGGRLGLVWNVRDESVDWVARITQIITPHEGDAPRFHRGDWRKPFPHAAFTPLQEAAFAHSHDGPPSVVIVDRILSVSFIASLDERGRAEVRAALEDLVATHPALRGQEVVRFPYRTLAFHCMRR
jgi:SAM-dependent methyltransferase